MTLFDSLFVPLSAGEILQQKKNVFQFEWSIATAGVEFILTGMS